MNDRIEEGTIRTFLARTEVSCSYLKICFVTSKSSLSILEAVVRRRDSTEGRRAGSRSSFSSLFFSFQCTHVCKLAATTTSYFNVFHRLVYSRSIKIIVFSTCYSETCMAVVVTAADPSVASASSQVEAY